MQNSFVKLNNLKWVINPLFYYMRSRKMEDFKEKLFNLIKPICELNNIFLYGVELKGSHKNRLIRVTVDTEEGVTLNECQLLNREISDLFFRKDVIKTEYRLEVTSPGINKPLQYPFEYHRNIGRDLKVSYNKNGMIKEIIGKLVGYNEKNITLENSNEKIIIAVEDIKKAIIKLQW